MSITFPDDPFVDPPHRRAPAFMPRSLLSHNTGNQHKHSALIRRAYDEPTTQVQRGNMTNKDSTAPQQRQNTYPHLNGYANGNMFGANQAQILRTNPYMNTGASTQHASMGHDANVAALASGFTTLNLRAPTYASTGTASSQIPAASADFAHHHAVPVSNQPYWMTGQQVMYSTAPMMPAMGQTTGMQHPGVYAAANYHVPHSNYPTYAQHGDHHSPMSANFTTPRGPSGEMPTLITPRRDSVSSNEADNLPGTPYTHYGNFHGAVAIHDRSPNGAYAHSGTPSPSQLVPGYGMTHLGKPQPPMQAQLPVHLALLLEKEPRIPHAIPAPSSPIKPLDRSLENKNGETNVYIRGLMPETSDDCLHEWGSRFGDIQSSKAIIEMKTNLCKGFGFIKYHNFEDAENCIRGFHYLGYEVSFARESFYAKLKKFADDNNTNLYVSNIPRSMNEHDLACVFAPHKVCSARILRDSQGNGRGVGFARFETREVCEEVIKIFNNKTIAKGDDDYTIQIRYSDTHEQKSLKQTTAAARQYRAAEFEYGVMQARGLLGPATGLAPPMEQRSVMSLSAASDAGTDFEGHRHNELGYGYHQAFPGAASAYPSPSPSHVSRYANSALRYPASVGARPVVGGVSLPVPPTHMSAPVAARAEDVYKANIGTNGDAKEGRPATPVVAHGDANSTSDANERD